MKQRGFRETTLGVSVAVLLLIIATSPFWAVMVIRQKAIQIVDDSLSGLAASSLATVSMSDGFMELSLAFATKDLAARARQFDQIRKVTVNTDEALKQYEQSVNDPAEQADLNQLIQARGEFRRTRERVIQLLGEGRDAEAAAEFNDVGLKQFVGYKAAINRLVQHNAEEARDRGTTIRQLCTLLLFLQGILLVFFVIYAFLVPMVALFERFSSGSEVVRDI